jgi:hypothetical protein
MHPIWRREKGCPGLTFGVASIEYVTANSLYSFDWKLHDDNVQGEDLDMTEVNGFTVMKKNLLHLHYKKIGNFLRFKALVKKATSKFVDVAKIKTSKKLTINFFDVLNSATSKKF